MALLPTAKFAANLLDAGGEVFNVRHPSYGAVGDGVADDGPAWNLARAAVNAAGGIVIVPQGAYLLTTAFTFAAQDDVLLWLLPGVVLTGSALPAATGDNAILDWRNGIWDYSSDLIAAGGFRNSTASKSSVYQLEIAKDTGGGGILCWRDLSNITANAILGLLAFGGDETGSDFLATVQAAGLAQENWTASAKGSYYRVMTVPIGSTTIGEKMRVDADGGMHIGTGFTTPPVGGLRTEGGIHVEAGPVIHALVTTLANDATPSVSAGDLFKTGGTTTITDLDDGVVGQTIRILSEHAVTITDGTNILLNGSADFVMAAGDVLVLTMYNDQVWVEDSRQVN